MVILRKIFFKFYFIRLQEKRASFLLEALLAVLILSVGLVGLIRGLLSSLNAAKEAQFYSRAILAADNALLDVIRLNGQHTGPLIQLDLKSRDFQGQIAILPSTNGQTFGNLREAHVKIKWLGPLKQKEVDAVTLVFGPFDEKK